MHSHELKCTSVGLCEMSNTPPEKCHALAAFFSCHLKPFLHRSSVGRFRPSSAPLAQFSSHWPDRTMIAKFAKSRFSSAPQGTTWSNAALGSRCPWSCPILACKMSLASQLEKFQPLSHFVHVFLHLVANT